MNMFNKIPPFKWFVLQNFPFIEEDFDSITNYQLLCKVVEYLNTTITKTNELGQQVEILTNWFNNLDVQDEINNKLDEMAESGQLAEIIAQYLQLAGLLCFNTVNDMKNATNLIDGSFAKTFGLNTYNDGKGEFYKIREIINTDIVDNVNIIALNNFDTLIAEKIPNYEINQINKNINEINKTFNQLQSLNIENILFNDIQNNKPLQGICVNNEIAYVYNETNFPYGDILIYNLNTASYINKIENIKLYHGNDMVFLNNNIYVASCKDDNGNLNNKVIVKLNLNNNSVTELNPFSDTEYTDLFAITKYDEHTLLCLLNKSTELFENLTCYLYDINNGNITNIHITNSKNLQTNFWSVFQSCEYNNGFVYLIVNQPNAILKLKLDIENNNLNFEGLYNIENFDNLGLSIGEIEGISLANILGNNTFIISSQIFKNINEEEKTLKLYALNPISNIPLLEKANWYDNTNSANHRSIIYVNNTSNSLYENGSYNYPFKDLGRAIESTNSKLANQKTIRITGGTNYTLSSIYNKNLVLENYSNTSVRINGNIIQFINCKVFINGDDTYPFEIYCNKIVFDNTTGCMKRSDLYDTSTNNAEFINIINHSNFNLYSVNVTVNQNRNASVLCFTGSKSILGIDNFYGNSNYYISVTGLTLAIVPNSLQQTKISKSGSATVIKGGSWIGF